MIWSCTIPGSPIGKGRARQGKPKLGRSSFYTPERTRRWEDDAAWTMSNAWKRPPLLDAVVLDVIAVAQRPKRLMGKSSPQGRIPMPVKPDWDNIGKIVSDALQKAGVVRDDAQVVDGRTRKFYAAIDEAPHVVVVLRLPAKPCPYALYPGEVPCDFDDGHAEPHRYAGWTKPEEA